MPWVKLDDRFFSNRKILDLSSDAKLVFVAGLCHCNEQLTDGFISTGAARTIIGSLGAKQRAQAELVDAGLWHKRDGGFDVHDFFDYQPSREEVMAEREATRSRVKEWRKKRKPNPPGNAVGNTVTPPVTNGVGNTPGNGVGTPASRTRTYPLSVVQGVQQGSAGPEATETDAQATPQPDPLTQRILDHIGDNPRTRKAATELTTRARNHLDPVDIDTAIGRAITNDARTISYFETAIRDQAAQHDIAIPPKTQR